MATISICNLLKPLWFFFCNSTSVKLPLLNILVMSVAKSTEHFPVFTLLDFSVIFDIGDHSALPQMFVLFPWYPWHVCVCVRTHLCSAMFNSLRPWGLQPARFLCSWYSLGKNTGMGCYSLLQGIFLTQGFNLGLLNCRQILYHWAVREAPSVTYTHLISSLVSA